MSYLALARKYRPETFAEMIGQEHVTATLRAAHRRDKLSHAYLFAGPRGCGKTTVARLLAKALNCAATHEGDPCGQCEACTGIARGTFLDVLEIDAASHTGVDNVRELRDMAQYTPGRGHSRVFIIDEVHMLSKGAFNALLKILEEPPARVFFFFATTEPNKIPRTILSRCQRFDFRLLTAEELGGRLAHIAASEGVDVDESGLRILVSLAEGSLRDGISLLDQAASSCEGTIDAAALIGLYGLIRSELYLDFNDAILAGDAARALRLVDELTAAGHSVDTFAQGVVTDFRNLLLLRVDPELARAVNLPPEQLERLRAQAERWAVPDLLALLDRAAQHFERIHRSTQPRILLEAAVVEYCHFESRVLLADLIRRLDGDAGLAGDSGPSASRTDRSESGSASGEGERRGRAASRGGRGRRTGSASMGGPRATAGGGAIGAADADAENAEPRAATARAARAKAAAATVPGWTDFVRSLLETHPRLASCLMEALPSLDEQRASLTLALPAERSFQLQQLESDLAVIQERTASFWGQALRVSAVLAEEGPSRAGVEAMRREVTPSDRDILDRACQQDRPLSELVDLLRGEPLPPDERRRWSPSGADDAEEPEDSEDPTS